MKKIALVAVLALAPTLAFAKEATETMKYSGWHCAGCGSKVEAAVKGVDGVKSAKVTKDTITVTYDDAKANHDKIANAIASAGKYTVKDEKAADKPATN